MAVQTAPTTSRGQRTLKIHVSVNGTPHDVEVEARTLLVHFLRENLGMTGTHIGCGTSSKPAEMEIREAISGNLCRWSGYVNIVKSIDHAAKAMRESAEGKA